MIKLSDAVRQELERNVYLLDILQSGFGNISAVASGLKKRIEATCSQKIAVSTISMAIRRYLRQNKPIRICMHTVPSDLWINVMNGMNEISFSKRRKKYIGSLRELAFSAEANFSMVEGQFETLLFFRDKDLNRIRSSLDLSKANVMISGLSCISVQWPAVTKDIPGIYYKVARALAIRDISVQSLHTIGSEMMVVVKSEFAEIATDALRRAL